MKRIGLTAVALLLAAQTSAEADSRIARLCGPDHVREIGGAMEPFLLITFLLNFDGTVVTGNHENGFPPKVLASEAECKYLKHQYEFMWPAVGLKYLSTSYICEREKKIIASAYNAQTTSQPQRLLSRRPQGAGQRSSWALATTSMHPNGSDPRYGRDEGALRQSHPDKCMILRQITLGE